MRDCLLVLFILLTRGTTSDVKHRAIVTQVDFRRYWQYHVRLLFYVFFGIYAVVKQTPVLFFTPRKAQRRNAYNGNQINKLTITSLAL